MIRNPALNPYYIAKIIPNEGLVLITEFRQIVCHGQIYEAVFRLIERNQSTEVIVDNLSDWFPASYIYYILLKLEKDGYLVEKEYITSKEETAYWMSQNKHPQVMKSVIADQTIAVHPLGNLDPKPLENIFLKMDFKVNENSTFDVVITDHYLRKDLINYCKLAHQEQRPLLLVKPVGLEFWIGPLFVPGRKGCCECLQYFLNRNNKIENFVSEKQESDEPCINSNIKYPPILELAYNFVAIELSKYLAQPQDSLLIGKVLSTDTRTWKVKYHTVLSRPGCKHCNTVVDKNLSYSFSLKDFTTRYVHDGGYRSISTKEIVKKYKNFVSPITGIIASLQANHHDEAYVYFAGHNHAAPIQNLSNLKKDLRSHSSGKGMTSLAAKAGALCEAIERYSGEFQGTEQRIVARYNDIANQAIHPNACMLFSERQYKERETWNKQSSRFVSVPQIFNPSREIEWSPLWSLSQQCIKYLPTQYLYYDYRYLSDPSSNDYCTADSNGNAAGGTLEEAILQGFFELVERDCIAIWWYNRINRPAVNWHSFENPYLSKIFAQYESQQQQTWILDLTNDLNIPTFAAISNKLINKRNIMTLGFGCHFDVNIALTRAVTEMNQMFVAAQGIANESIEKIDPILVNWMNSPKEEYLYPDPMQPLKTKNCFTALAHDNHILKNIKTCQSIVESKGIELLVLNQTRPEIGLNVVKVVCPGLRHFWTRFAPGRLYDVPVQMGWLKQPLKEEDLNPIPIFF